MANKIKESKSPINRTEEDPFCIQHDSLDYYKPSYLTPIRMSSYGYQFDLAMRTNCKSFLNIGSANDILSDLLTKQDKFVVNIDLDINTKPSVNAVLPLLPFTDDTFDVVMCFQILEHMPFSIFPEMIIEIKRVTKKYIILSVPDISLSRQDRLKYKFYQMVNRPSEWSKYQNRTIDKEHFWEIGFGDISEMSLIKIFEKENLAINNNFRNKHHSYHHFFLLQKITYQDNKK